MLDWLTGSAKDLPIWGQLFLDAFKILMGFGTVVLVTRWTLSRADRKDAISRQAIALDSYSAGRIESLHLAVLALSKIRNELNKIYGALDAPIKEPHRTEVIDNFLLEIEDHIDDLMLALEEYDGPPASIPCDFEDASEALIPWLKGFYEQRAKTISDTSIAVMMGMCADLQTQLRWLGRYELNMRLQVGLNPASAWNPDFGNVLESTALEFFTQDGPRTSGKPVRVIGTIVEQDSEEDKAGHKRRAKRVLVFGEDRLGDKRE